MFAELLFKVFRKEYHIKGEIDSFFLERASKNQLRIIESIFGVKVNSRFTEIFFKPEFKFYYPGKDKSFLGIIDSRLSGSFFILKWIARQQSFIAKKVD